jgi:hypothetical protein
MVSRKIYKETEKEIVMTNKERIERNMGLTFDFVNHLIDNKSELMKLPDNFTIEFIEKDFSKLQYSKPDNHEMPNTVKQFVQVKNSFATV